jgi:hypothetical protein
VIGAVHSAITDGVEHVVGCDDADALTPHLGEVQGAYASSSSAPIPRIATCVLLDAERVLEPTEP